MICAKVRRYRYVLQQGKGNRFPVVILLVKRRTEKSVSIFFLHFFLLQCNNTCPPIKTSPRTPCHALYLISSTARDSLYAP